MSFEPHDFLRHMLAETAFLIESSAKHSVSDFKSDPMLSRAVIRSLEIIGEASKNIPEHVRLQHAEIDFRALAGLRDRLIHAYFGVDYDLVWAVVTERIPELHGKLLAILKA